MFPPNHLVDDVLLIIFDHLDGLDLIQCEVVCSQWRRLLLSGTPWKRWLHRRITDASFAAFREAWWKMEVDEGEMQTAHYRSHCRAILQQLEENNQNWRNGNMKESLIWWLDLALPQEDYLNDLELNLINGRIAVHLCPDSLGNQILLFLDQCGQVQSKVLLPSDCHASTDGNIVVQNFGRTKIFDNTGQLIAELHDFGENYLDFNKVYCIWQGQMAALGGTRVGFSLSVWNIQNSKITCSKRRPFLPFLYPFSEAHPSNIKMDEQFIVILISDFMVPSSFIIISVETLEIKGKIRLRNEVHRSFVYEKGLLVFLAKDCFSSFSLRVYDLPSWTFIREIKTTLKPFSSFKLKRYVCFNSQFMIVSGERGNRKTKLKIYDLEAIKNPESKEESLLIRTLHLKHPLRPMAVDDTQIVYSTVDGILILKFVPKPH